MEDKNEIRIFVISSETLLIKEEKGEGKLV